MTEESAVLEKIADWCLAYRSTDGQRDLAKDAIVDTSACMHLGRTDPVVDAVKRAYLPDLEGAGRARVVGGDRASAPAAAAINGTAAHALDFDDNFRPALSHASAVSVPALLAIADDLNLSGKHLVDAYLVAIQVQGLIGSGVIPSHYTFGWHSTSTIGTIGTAAGVGHLLSLDRDGLIHAMSLATSFAAGSKAQFGAPVKPFHAGMAAKNAIEAAFLARAGLQGQVDIIERGQGFLELFGGTNPRGYADLNTDPDSPHYLETHGVMPKRFACCGSSHMAIDMALELREEGVLTPENFDRIIIKVRIANFRNMPFTRPQNQMEARFSIQYCVARALRAGRLSVSDFTPASVAANAADPLLQKIEMTHYSPEEEAAEDFLPHAMTVTLNDGTQVERSRRNPKGSLSDPFSVAQKRDKFIDCLGRCSGSKTLFDTMQTLEQHDTLEPLDTLFV